MCSPAKAIRGDFHSVSPEAPECNLQQVLNAVLVGAFPHVHALQQGEGFLDGMDGGFVSCG